MSTLVSANPEAGRAEVRRDIEYSRPDGISLWLDASIPSGRGPFAAVIVVHGGGWIRGDRAVDVAPILPPLTEAGIAWFSASYRLVSDITQFGIAVDDVKNAIRFVKAHAAEYRIDPDRVALVGESAGGQLAAMSALSGDPELAVRAVVALYTPTDLVALADNAGFVPKQVRDSVRGTPFEGMILARLKELSPIEHVHAGMPPFLFIHGTEDALVPFSESTAMCDRMKSVGASCRVYPVEGGGHGVRWWESIPALRSAWKREMISWLEDRLAPVRAAAEN